MQVMDGHSLVGIHEALRQCDSLELELRSSLDARHVRALRQAVQRNSRISTVNFHLHNRWEEMSSRMVVAELVTTVAALPNLKEVVVAGNYAPMPAITTLLNHTSQLQHLILHRFRNLKDCDTQVLVDLCKALQRHKALKTLSFKPQLENTACEPKEIALLQMLMEALAESPVLREVELQTNLEYLSGPPLVKLCNSTTLTKLELTPKGGVGVDGLQALARNTSIQELRVSCQMSERCCAAASLLLNANTTLRSLILNVPQRGMNYEESSQRFTQAIADVLRTNTTLCDLRVPFGSLHPTVPVLTTFVDMLHDNCTLQTLEVFSDMSRVQRANHEDIENMPSGTAKSALLLGKRIQYYTLLNRIGRGALLSGGPSRGHWVDKIIEYSYSIDILFFVLRTNPTLCKALENNCMELD